MTDIYEGIDKTTDTDQLRRMAKGWVDSAATFARNEDFYRVIVHKTAEALGRECWRQDDGNFTDDPLALRVPEVAAAIVTPRYHLLAALDKLAEKVMARHPGVRVGFAASVSDSDWCVYIDGPGMIFGHDMEDLVAASVELDRPDRPFPRHYCHGAFVAAKPVSE